MATNMYRPIKTNAEYFNNWVPKFDLLCKPQAEVGFLGSSFFIGILFAISWVPTYSDANGRKPVILGSLCVQLFAQVGLMASGNLYFAYICMFLLGATFPGKNVVFYGYAMDIIDPAFRQTVVNVQSACETSIIILISLYYSHLSRNWIYLNMIGTAISVGALCFVSRFSCESPKFLYSKGRFEEAREAMRGVTEFNGIDSKEMEFVFDTENVTCDPLAVHSEEHSIPETDHRHSPSNE